MAVINNSYQWKQNQKLVSSCGEPEAVKPWRHRANSPKYTILEFHPDKHNLKTLEFYSNTTTIML